MKKLSVEMNWGESVIEDSKSKKWLRQLTESTCLIVNLSGQVIKKVAAIDLVMKGKERKEVDKEERTEMEY